MPIQAGSFRSRSTTGVDAVTGLSFAPEALVLTVMSADFSDTAMTTEIFSSYTITDGTTTRCVAVRDDYNASTMATARAWYDSIVEISHLAAVIADGDLTLTSDGFEINWTTISQAWSVCWWAIGGTGISTKVLTFDRSSTGTASVTGAGFEPKALVGIGQGTAAAPSATDGDAFAMVGLADENVDNAGSGVAMQDNVSNVNAAYRVSDTNLFTRSTPSGTLDTAIAITSLDSDGFSYNATTHPASSRYYAVLCLGGADITATSLVDLYADATSGAHTQTFTGLPFQPTSGLIAGTSSTSYTNGIHAHLITGAFDRLLSQWGTAIDNRDVQPSSDAREVPSDTSALIGVTTTGVPGSLAAVGEITAIGATSIDVAWLASKLSTQFLWPTLLFEITAQTVNGTAAGTFGALTGTASGSSVTPVTGTAVAAFGPLTGTALGTTTPVIEGTAAGAFGPLTGTALGVHTALGSGVADFGELHATATAFATVVGTGTATFGSLIGTVITIFPIASFWDAELQDSPFRADLLPATSTTDTEPSPLRADLQT